MQASPRQRLGELVLGFMPSQLVYVMARLGIADLLRDAPMTVDELGGATGVQPSVMRRLVRGLAGLGLVGIDDDDRVSVTELGTLLGSSTRGSMRDVALYFGGEGFPAWGELHHALTTGELAFKAARGETFFDYLERHPQASAAFNGTMTQMSHGVVAQAVAACDFSSATAVLDVAGGHGHFVAAALEANAELSGAVFDLPHVIEAAAQYLASRGLTDRCAVIGGSFFEALPAGYDLHILKWILHDWNDDACAKLLATCRGALPDGGRLLIVERLVPESTVAAPTLHPAIASDLHMLVTFGDAMERSLTEFDQLLAHSGFVIDDVLSLPSGFSVLVCGKGERSPT